MNAAVTRALALAATTALIAAWLVAATALPANAAVPYCGTGVKYTLTTVTRYVAPAWDRPGYRLMGKRRLWSATSHYYICRPR